MALSEEKAAARQLATGMRHDSFFWRWDWRFPAWGCAGYPYAKARLGVNEAELGLLLLARRNGGDHIDAFCRMADRQIRVPENTGRIDDGIHAVADRTGLRLIVLGIRPFAFPVRRLVRSR